MADDTESINIPQVSASDLNPPGTSEDYSDEARELGLDQDYSVTHPNVSQAGSPPDSYSQEMSELGLDKDYDVKKAVGPSGAGGSNATTGTGTPKQVNSNLNLSTQELINLKEKDPAGYQAYIDRKTSATRGEFAYGLGDVPRSIARATAAVAPTTFNAIAKAAVPVYASLTGQPQLSPQEAAALPSPAMTFQNALQERNNTYQQQYGNDPNQQGNRLVGQLVGAGPVAGAVNKGVGAAVDMAAPYLPSAVNSTLDFLGGNKASNAIVDQSTGRVIQGSTLGNKVGQYLSTGTNAALQAAPLTALTAAGSNTSLPTQLRQNAIVGGVLGAATPALLDAGIGVGNFTKRMATEGADAVSQRVENILQKTAGGLPTQMDTTEYIPGWQPTTAQAAAAAGDPNAANLAAVERVLSQAKPGNEQLVSPEFNALNASQQTAQRNAVLALTGTPQDVADIRNATIAAAKEPMGNETARAFDPTIPKGSVWATAGTADPTSVVAAIDRMAAGTAKDDKPLQTYIAGIKELLQKPDATNPQYIYDSIVRPKVIEPSLGDLSNTPSQSMLLFAKKLKPALDDVIEAAAPGYTPYRQAYSAGMQKADRLEALQSFKLVSPTAESGPGAFPTANGVKNAMDKLANNVNNTDPTNPLRHVTPEDVNALQKIQKTLDMQQAPDRLLKQNNSATSQNTRLTQNLTDALGLGEPKGIGKILNAPNILGTAGGAIGGSVGSHLGPWGTMAGTEMGGAAGISAGKMLQAGKRAAASQGVNRLVELMRNPENVKAYQATQSAGGSMLRNVGEMLQLQRLLGAAAPVAALGYNKTNALPVSGQ